MLHTKFRVHRTISSREKDVLKFLTYGRASHVGHVIQTILYNFSVLNTLDAYMKFCVNQLTGFRVFSGEVV